MSSLSSLSSLPNWLVQALEGLQSGDVDAYMAMYADDAVHEFPFAPSGGVSRLEGYDAIAAYMQQLPASIAFGTLSDIRVHEAGDQLIVEATGHHRRLADGTPFELSYVWFITRRHGKVHYFRDYMNPLQLSAL